MNFFHVTAATRPREQRSASGKYALVLVSPAPLPPHERPWRHPSELAPTRDDVEPEVNRFTLPLIVGSATMLVVAVLVVAITPSPSASDPIALSGTTTPARLTRAAPADEAVVRIAAFTPIPNAVAAIPTFHIDGRRAATRLPRANEWVLAQTESATYRLLWGEVQWLDVDGLAVIVDESLALIGYIDHGHFYPLVDR